jgi:hypothetical protein
MLNKSGVMTVRAYTAGGALPIPDATVRIFGAEEENKDVVFSLVTDEDGLTKSVTLPTPDISVSLDQNANVPAYSLYNVEIFKEGYYSKRLYNVPVFPETNSEQLISMIPFSSFPGNYPLGNINTANEYSSN